MRDLVGQIHLDIKNFVYPVFIEEGQGIKAEISALPGHYRYSPDRLDELVSMVKPLGITSLLLFGIPAHKDEQGSEAYNDEGIVQQAIRRLKEIYPESLLITDVCLCEFTSTGHCGIVHNDAIDNDLTIPLLAQSALSHVKAGADMVAPSDMMDGRVAAIRSILDDNGYTDTPIMSYSTKFASSYYGPFRHAADCAPKFGDRKSHQMDYRRSNGFISEALTDIKEGADIVMVKPALPYLDIIRETKDVVDVPLAVYNVSGEYSMVKAAAAHGWIDEKGVVRENMYAFKRAGADIIISYHTPDIAKWLKEGEF